MLFGGATRRTNACEGVETPCGASTQGPPDGVGNALKRFDGRVASAKDGVFSVPACSPTRLSERFSGGVAPEVARVLAVPLRSADGGDGRMVSSVCIACEAEDKCL